MNLTKRCQTGSDSSTRGVLESISELREVFEVFDKLFEHLQHWTSWSFKISVLQAPTAKRPTYSCAQGHYRLRFNSGDDLQVTDNCIGEACPGVQRYGAWHGRFLALRRRYGRPRPVSPIGSKLISMPTVGKISTYVQDFDSIDSRKEQHPSTCM